MHGLGRSKRTDAPAHLHDQLLTQSIAGLLVVLEGDKCGNSLAGELVGHTDDSRLGNKVMLNQCSLDLRGGQTVTTDVDNVVNAAPDPVEALMVPASAITGELIQS